MKNTFRCKCPITSALDILGDKWSLVVIKQMLFEGKSMFKDFTDSPEAIATNILSARLKTLEDFGIIDKQKLPTNRKTNIYTLTAKGLSLVPVLVEFTLWSKNHVQDFNPDMNLDEKLEWVEKNKEAAFKQIAENYKEYKQSLLKVKKDE
ncbi:winged helix-turn-helix transcriptional regulator [Marinifilum caeruleilacunae]|uniref:Transcriptional regulator n=1 Tax=Marinifilum caeruleilacunae TaxID=2499076 RepID=A0ABX1WUY6_9BACT|nr:helix-turn-helix domain-containing protein [Marinifilum caeruleilacunae]NOU59923.1 transcriptional regulator [Marinifilum caeruleilacunae]